MSWGLNVLSAVLRVHLTFAFSFMNGGLRSGLAGGHFDKGQWIWRCEKIARRYSTSLRDLANDRSLHVCKRAYSSRSKAYLRSCDEANEQPLGLLSQPPVRLS
eukprot:1992249-Prorocentrum_lima.AAC.2